MHRRRLGVVCAFILSGSAFRADALLDNGIATQETEFPQVVALKTNQLCSGTIIGPNTVLTAAHCLKVDALFSTTGQGYLFPASEITILIPGKGEFPASETFVSPCYVESASTAHDRCDIGVVKLSSPSPFNDYIPVRAGRHAHESDFSNLPVTLVGYGSNDHSTFHGNGTQRKGTNQIAAAISGIFVTVGLKHDRDQYWGLSTKADGREVGPNHGDSGGPMLAEGGVIGVIVEGLDQPTDIESEEKELGALLGQGVQEKLRQMTKDGKMSLAFSDSLSDPGNIEFLKSAEKRGYEIAWAQNPPHDPAHDVRPPKSTTLLGSFNLDSFKAKVDFSFSH